MGSSRPRMPARFFALRNYRMPRRAFPGEGERLNQPLRVDVTLSNTACKGRRLYELKAVSEGGSQVAWGLRIVYCIGLEHE